MESYCRICFDDEDQFDLFSPCACRGTALYVHRQCLLRWTQESGNAFSCETCLNPYYVFALTQLEQLRQQQLPQPQVELRAQEIRREPLLPLPQPPPRGPQRPGPRAQRPGPRAQQQPRLPELRQERRPREARPRQPRPPEPRPQDEPEQEEGFVQHHPQLNEALGRLYLVRAPTGVLAQHDQGLWEYYFEHANIRLLSLVGWALCGYIAFYLFLITGLEVTIHSAVVPSMDVLLWPQSDAYVIACIGNNCHTKPCRTDISDNNNNPRWEHACDTWLSESVFAFSQLTFYVYDADFDSNDDLIGEVSINLLRVMFSRNGVNTTLEWDSPYRGSLDVSIGCNPNWLYLLNLLSSSFYRSSPL